MLVGQAGIKAVQSYNNIVAFTNIASVNPRMTCNAYVDTMSSLQTEKKQANLNSVFTQYASKKFIKDYFYGKNPANAAKDLNNIVELVNNFDLNQVMESMNDSQKAEFKSLTNTLQTQTIEENIDMVYKKAEKPA
jgi:hypothetical protein